jgi:hypothetical protein
VDLRTGRVTGLEALLRWRSSHARIGEPPSAESAFEDIEMANAISTRMIARVVADVGTWLAEGVTLSRSRSMPRRRVPARRLRRARARAAGRARTATRHFELEVNVHRALDFLSRDSVSIALDDFGTGYASLRHPKQFPVDTIKVDHSFVRDMEEDAGDEAIIRAVINLRRRRASRWCPKRSSASWPSTADTRRGSCSRSPCPPQASPRCSPTSAGRPPPGPPPRRGPAAARRPSAFAPARAREAIAAGERPQSTPATAAIVVSNIGANTADLRGLGANRTLVLIDGRRVVPATVAGGSFTASGTVDLNMVPTSLLERAEVVTAGASAAYGSDAVAGVVNLILDTDLEGVRASAQFGMADAGDDLEVAFSLAGGGSFADDRGRVVAGVEFVRDEGADDCSSRDWCALSYNTVSNPFINPANPSLGRTLPGAPATLILPNTRTATSTINGIIARWVRSGVPSSTQRNHLRAQLWHLLQRGHLSERRGRSAAGFLSERPDLLAERSAEQLRPCRVRRHRERDRKMLRLAGQCFWPQPPWVQVADAEASALRGTAWHVGASARLVVGPIHSPV